MKMLYIFAAFYTQVVEFYMLHSMKMKHLIFLDSKLKSYSKFGSGQFKCNKNWNLLTLFAFLILLISLHFACTCI